LGLTEKFQNFKQNFKVLRKSLKVLATISDKIKQAQLNVKDKRELQGQIYGVENRLTLHSFFGVTTEIRLSLHRNKIQYLSQKSIPANPHLIYRGI